PGVTSPTIDDAIGGSLNFVTGNDTRPPSGSFSVSSDGFGGFFSELASSGTLLHNRLSYSLGYQSGVHPSPFGNGPFSSFGYAAYGINSVDGQPFTCDATCAPSTKKNYPTLNPNVQSPPIDTSGTVLCCFTENYNAIQHNAAFKVSYDLSANVSASFYTSAATTFQDRPFTETTDTF